ncbi:MAG: O-antigen ligase family protein [Planctomycetota bacterium]
MIRILAAAAVFIPLAASPAFSDFNPPKLIVFAILSLVGLIWLWGPDRRCAIAAREVWAAGLAIGGLLFFASMLGSAHSGGLAFDGLRDLGGLGLAFGLAFMASRVPLTKSDRATFSSSPSFLIFAGAFAPLAILLAQALLDLGINPLGLPHRSGVFSSTLGNSGFAGELAVLAIPFLSLLPRQIAASRARALTIAGSLAGILAVIWMSESRAAMVAAVLVTAFLLMTRRRASPGTNSTTTGLTKPWLALGLAGLLLSIGATLIFLQQTPEAPASPLKRLSSLAHLDRGTNLVRVELAKDSVEMFKDHPWFGVGGASFVNHHGFYRSAPEWSTSGLRSQVLAPHCEPLRVLTEYGLIAALAVMAGLFFLLKALLKGLRAGDEDRRARARAGIAALLGISCTGLFWFSFQVPSSLALAAIAIGLGLGRNQAEGLAKAGDTRLRVAMSLLMIASASVGLAVGLADLKATSSRDELEAIKAEIRERAKNQGPLPTEAIRRLGLEAQSIFPRLDDWRLSTPVRYRLLLALADISEERQRLEYAARRLTGSAEANRRTTAAIGLASSALPRQTAVLAALEKAHARAPGHIGTLQLLAETELRMSRKPEAIGRLEDILARNSDVPLLRPLLAVPFRDEKVQLYAQAAEHYRAEVDHYPTAPESDSSWRGLAECLGAQRKLEEAVVAVARWNSALGESPQRWAVAGAIALHYGETPSSLGRFRDHQASDHEQRAFSLKADSSRGLKPHARRVELLAQLGRHPENVAALDALQGVLKDLMSKARGSIRDDLESERQRALSRTKVLYAYDHFKAGNDRLVRISLRQARLLNPRQGDAYLLDLIQQTRKKNWGIAVQVAESWFQQGFRDFEGLRSMGGLEDFWLCPEWDRWRKERH